jgi:hypothetical protein
LNYIKSKLEEFSLIGLRTLCMAIKIFSQEEDVLVQMLLQLLVKQKLSTLTG